MEEQTETDVVKYRVVTDPEVEQYFNYDLEVDDEGFLYDDDENLVGAVVEFKEYPDHETLTAIFQDLLVKAVMQTQDESADDAREMIEECDDESDFPDELDLSKTFSLFFTVEGHSGQYRMLLDNNDYWVGYSNGRRNDRWDI
ncbi:hypothetical protein EHM69_00970 [candidate division KSB1 bacterium]|nr:MAG: hypothetical protein EHM69_00970 [candidate division KSB1 bacterium]